MKKMKGFYKHKNLNKPKLYQKKQIKQNKKKLLIKKIQKN